MGRAVRGLICALVMTTVAVAPLEAQRGGRGPQDRARLEQRIRARVAEMMRERLGLSDEEGARLSEVVQSFERERDELFRLEQATRRRVQALLLEESTDQAAAAELLDRMTELRAREAELFAREQAALLEVLSPIQLLELQELREQIGRQIRQLRGPRGEGRRGDGRRGQGAYRDTIRGPRGAVTGLGGTAPGEPERGPRAGLRSAVSTGRAVPSADGRIALRRRRVGP